MSGIYYFEEFRKLCMSILNENGQVIGMIKGIITYHGYDFENKDFANLCNDEGIKIGSQLPRHHNKMELWNARIALCKRWQG